MEIYFDNNATTQVDPRVLDAMRPILEGPPLNPSSVHTLGRIAKQHLSAARRSIASYLNCQPSELIFTSSGSESMNTLIHGLYCGGTILTSPLEHSCVLKTVAPLPHKCVMPTLDAIDAAMTSDVRLLVFSAVNGETGTMLDLQGMAELASFYRIPLIVDGVALLGRAPVTLFPGITAMAFSGHKIHGPKGAGLIYLRKKHPIKSLITGGAQESGHRAGTENLAGIVGLAEAIQLIDPVHFTHMQQLRDAFESGLDAIVNGEEPRIGNISNLYFPGIDGELLLMQLDQIGIYASHGSACLSGTLEPSHVLTALGYQQARIRGSIRFSFSRLNTLDEIKIATQNISARVSRRAKTPLPQ